MAKLIIVDDEKPIRSALRDILEYEGYDVDEAKDGEEGLDMITKVDYDVALCDIKMPKLGGLEVLVKSGEAGKSTQFVMISAYGNVEDMFVQELIPHIDSTFRTRTEREYRALSGLSMGGFGSLTLAMHHPELFSACAAMSAAVRTDESVATMPDDRYNTVFAPIFSGPVTGDERLTISWKRNSPITLAKSAPEGDLKKVRWYLDCGDDDALTVGNSMLHITLLDRKIPHEYRVRDGAHTWSYWRTGLPDALKFIATSFHH